LGTYGRVPEATTDVYINLVSLNAFICADRRVVNLKRAPFPTVTNQEAL
jgi:hypothetical protein